MSTNITQNTLPDWTALVRSKVDSLRFGSVLVTVHAGRVVQIECVEKTRLDLPCRATEDFGHGQLNRP